MPVVKPIGEIVAKWQSRAAVATQDYANGVSRPGVDWAGATAESNDAYVQGVQEAISRNAFVTGVQRAGNQRWQQRSREIGAQRFAGGVAASVDRYREGFAPYLSVIEGVTLPPRGPRGSAGNLQRVQLVADALHQARLTRG